ncbi:MAG: NUDIX hydrolase [bacterium]
MDSPEKRKKGIEGDAEQKEKPKTAAAVLVVYGDKVLVLKKRISARFHPLGWVLPGGRAEEDETILETAEIELHEETGLSGHVGAVIELDVKPFFYEETNTLVNYFIAESEIINIVLSEEHTEYRWVSKENWQELNCTPSCRYALENYFNK